ncbi:type II secretion system protein N, partial [Acinetobacter baumannii]
CIRDSRMNMPSLSGQLTDQNGQLQEDNRDQRNQKMANLLLDANMMLDVQLTQRLLLNVPSYDGKAGLDTFVISSRQPLLQGGN